MLDEDASDPSTQVAASSFGHTHTGHFISIPLSPPPCILASQISLKSLVDQNFDRTLSLSLSLSHTHTHTHACSKFLALTMTGITKCLPTESDLGAGSIGAYNLPPTTSRSIPMPLKM